MSERAAPFYCPYCGDEDLRPSETGGHGAWECASCRRAFAVKFLGLLSASATSTATTSTSTTTGGTSDDHRD